MYRLGQVRFYILALALPLFTLIAPAVSSATDAVFDLVDYMRTHVASVPRQDLALTIPKYDRVEMFGGWVNENAPTDCYNTRAEALIRDADKGSVKFNPANPCQVKRGVWHDPYTGTVYKLASAIQIDHVVPLKNAYMSGAHAWTFEQRCHYANYLDSPIHLRSVSAHENMSKGDSGPDEYIPPDGSFTCEYLTDWMMIKATWNLDFTREEKDAIEAQLTSSHCDISNTKIGASVMQEARANTQRVNDKCVVR